MLTLDQFDYHLPEGLIAQHPAEPRDHSRLLVLNKETQSIEHTYFFDLPQLLDENTVIVRNNTKVIPARLLGNKTTGGHVELLLNQRQRIGEKGEIWEVLTKPGLKVGQRVTFENSYLSATCIEVTGYTRIIEFNQQAETLFQSLYDIGHTPIPPYIEWENEDERQLRELYQTSYAKIEGSAAAPTAGLHFTPQIDKQLKDKGIQIEEVTLHVGLGTFLPVKDADITTHHMHSEYFEVSERTASNLNQAKAAGKKILAIGTTSMRTIESAVNEAGQLIAQARETDIYIYPPYQFRFVDQLITNFHLPKSTLLMLVSAFVSQPNTTHSFSNFLSTPVGKAYLEAIAKKYRFFSFGDAMLIR